MMVCLEQAQCRKLMADRRGQTAVISARHGGLASKTAGPAGTLGVFAPAPCNNL